METVRSAYGLNAPSRAVGFVAFLLFLGLGLFFVVMVIRGAVASAATYTWKSAPCEILQSEVRESSERSPWFAYLRYRSSAGESVRSSRLFGTYSDAVHFTRRWPTGSTTRCYLDPHDPAGTLLEHKGERLALALFLPIPLLSVFIGATGLYTVLFRVRPQPRTWQQPNPVAGRRLAAGFLMVTGSALFLAFLLVPVRHAVGARAWRALECKIVRSEVRGYRSTRGSDAYSPVILYSYVVDGQEHRSDTYSFFTLSNSGWAAARRLSGRYRRGSTVPCYVNPDDPDEATLHRSPSLGWLIGIVPLGLFVGGLRAWPRRTD